MQKQEDVKLFDIRFVANTDEKRRSGLMHSKPLREDEVAFFVFPSLGNYGFWNHNVSYPLSLAFVDENGKIVDFADMDANSKTIVEPHSSEVKYVVEATKDIFKKLKISKGDLVIYNKDKLQIKKM